MHFLDIPVRREKHYHPVTPRFRHSYDPARRIYREPGFREPLREASHSSGTAYSSRALQDSVLLYTRTGDRHIVSDEKEGAVDFFHEVYQASRSSPEYSSGD